MSDSDKISRRDWFRLRASRQNRLLGSEQSTIESDVLKPIELPPNHDGMNLAELPPMREAILSIEQVNALVVDIGTLAGEIQLMQRAAHSSRATTANADSIEQLEFAKTALLNGTVPRIQIRYRWQNRLWIDTLANESGKYRLVRISHQSL